MESIKNRRTIRKYKQDDVPAALLNDYRGIFQYDWQDEILRTCHDYIG